MVPVYSAVDRERDLPFCGQARVGLHGGASVTIVVYMGSQQRGFEEPGIYEIRVDADGRTTSLRGLGELALVRSLCPAESRLVTRWLAPREVDAIVIDAGTRRPLPGIGVVLDPSEPGKVRLRHAVSDAAGAVRFKAVEPGQYTLRIQDSGFVESSIGPFRVRAEEDENPVLPELVIVVNPAMYVDRVYLDR